MIFSSQQIRGDGIGTREVFPTINLEIPKDFGLETGVYAAKVKFSDDVTKTYKAALHYGSRPTFEKSKPSLEIYILSDNLTDKHSKHLEVQVVGKIRPIMTFASSFELKNQIKKDIIHINDLLGRVHK